MEVTKWTEALWKKWAAVAGSASVQAVTRVNAEQTLKRQCGGRPADVPGKVASD